MCQLLITHVNIHVACLPHKCYCQYVSLSTEFQDETCFLSVYKYSPDNLTRAHPNTNFLILCRPNFAKNTMEGAFLCENIYVVECIDASFTA